MLLACLAVTLVLPRAADRPFARPV
jgi:hypothetical protein